MGNSRSTLSKSKPALKLRKRGSLDNLNILALLSPRPKCKLNKKERPASKPASDDLALSHGGQKRSNSGTLINHGDTTNLYARSLSIASATTDAPSSGYAGSSLGVGSTISGSRLSVPGLDISLPALEIPPHDLSPRQMALVKATWHAVLSDSSNICLNFFLQLQRRYPHIKKMQQKLAMANSAPSLPSAVHLMTRNRSCSSDPQKQSQLPQHALRLACCLDNLITKNGEVSERDMINLEEAGNDFMVSCQLLFYATAVRDIKKTTSEGISLYCNPESV